MKQFLSFILAITLAACGSSKNYLERADQDKALADAVKRLSKDHNDEKALEAVPVLYADIQKKRVARINSYQTSRDISRWDKIVNEYEALQSAYDAVINSTPAFKLVTPVNYSTELMDAKQSAADEYYTLGTESLSLEGRENAKKAYTYFKKSEKFVPGYKDARNKMTDAYESAVVDVIINPVQDNSFFFNSRWGNSGYNYSNEYFQQTLVRDLQSQGNSSRYPARFYTEWQARRDNVQPDWVVDLRLRDMDIPYPSTYNYSRNVTNRIQVGSDTAGRPVYQTVSATLHINRTNFNARANMEVVIQDVETRRNISSRMFREDVRWQEETGTYTGDSRALSSRDWEIINNSRNMGYTSSNGMRREDILGELYRRIYPQVLNNIRYAVDW